MTAFSLSSIAVFVENDQILIDRSASGFRW